MKLCLLTFCALFGLFLASPASANSFSLTLNTTQVVGGTSVTGTILESSASGGTGDSYSLSATGTGLSIPATVMVAPYSKTASFTLTTSTVSFATPSSVTAVSASMGSQTAGLTVVGSAGFYSPYSFTGDVDGNLPVGGVAIDGSGNIYGTANQGGTYGYGTIWELSASGSFSVLYSFTGNDDGGNPTGGIALDGLGNLYGTTNSGGTGGGGTIWQVTTLGAFNLLYGFSGNADGGNPYGGVALDSSGNLYGTTYSGGSGNSGTVWQVTTGGTFSTLYSFTDGSDGGFPYGGVAVDVSGNLYGTASAGGDSDCGTVWKLTTGGFTNLYSFSGGTDGSVPYGGISIDASGNVFGTTSEGGANDGGTIWQITAAGAFNALYSFAPDTDGNYSVGSVAVDPSGNLFGTTSAGGTGANGTLWEYSAGGSYSVLYSFSGNADGSGAGGNIALDASGALYGVAASGGSVSDGTIWIQVPAPPALAGITLSTNSAMGGGSLIGTVSLTSPARPGGYSISLASNSRFAVVPPGITVPAGATTASFPVWTDPCSSTQAITLSASDSITTFMSNLTLTAYTPSVFVVQFPSTFVVGGGTVTGSIQVDHYVTSAGGEVVALSASNADGSTPAAASVPSSITIPFGANSASFTVTTSSVSSVTGVNILATDGATQEGLLMVMPSGGLGLGLTVAPQGIFGGNSAAGTVRLNTAQTVDTIVSLSSNNSGVTVPASVTVPAGQTSTTFPVSTSAISGSTSVLNGGWIWIAASTGASSQAIPISIYPAQLHFISASPGSVTGGGSATGTVGISGTAPAGGISVSLSSNSGLVTLPATVTIPAGSSTATFSISTATTSSAVTATLSAIYSTVTKTCSFNIGVSVLLHSIVANPGTVVGGSTSTGTVGLTGPAPSGGVTVNLSSNSVSAMVPSTVLIPAGSVTATFGITTAPVSSAVHATLTASLGAVSKSCAFIISSPSLIGLSGTTSVVGGQLVTVTATLNQPAPVGGILVPLSSSNTSFATVPSTVLIPEGASSARFTVTTNSVTAAKSVTITGVLVQTIHFTLKLLP